MALTLITAPENVHFARNPAIVNIRADADGSGTLYDAVGETAKVAYSPANRFDTNETLTITYTEADGTSETVVFTAKAVYDDDDEIPDNSFAGSDSEYWIAIRDIVAAHPRIAPFITVFLTASGGEKLNIRLNSADAGWALTVSNTGGFTVTEDAAAASSLPENYKVKIEVFFENTYRAGDYALAAQLEGVPQAGTGYVYFDLSSVLTAECRAARAEPLVPQFGTDEPFLADNFRRYYFRYTEEYGVPVEVQDWAYAGTKIALDGGVSQARFAEGDFLGAMDDEDALLTWMPDGKKVGLEQPEYLAWYNHTGGTQTVYLRVVWYSIEDGTFQAVTDYFTPGLSVRADEVAVFPVWPALFGLDSEPTAYKYTVQVYRTVVVADPVSQARTYYIDREYYESERYLMYLNSFGCPETWRCTGQWGKRLRVERQIASAPLLPGYNELASDRFQFGRLWDNELTYRTGFLTKDEAEVLQELLIAGDVYDVSEEGYIPLQITSNDFKVTETRQELHAYEFTAQPRLDMKNYSKKKLSSLLSDSWLDEFGQPWFDAFTVAWEVP